MRAKLKLSRGSVELDLCCLQAMSMNEAWSNVLPSPLSTICRAIADGDRGLELPLTINSKRQLIPLNVLCTLEPFMVRLTGEAPPWVGGGAFGKNAHV